MWGYVYADTMFAVGNTDTIRAHVDMLLDVCAGHDSNATAVFYSPDCVSNALECSFAAIFTDTLCDTLRMRMKASLSGRLHAKKYSCEIQDE